MKTVLILSLIFTCETLFAQAESKLLTENFYKLNDVCTDARKSDPTKKAALILLKTHYCDANTNVCLNSLRTLTDPANVFVSKYFVTYQTRFATYEGLKIPGLSSNQLYERDFRGEKEIRDEWNKQDTNPEIAVVDLRTCKVLGKEYLKKFRGAFSIQFDARYLAMRRTILSIPGVADLLGIDIFDLNTLSTELTQAQLIRLEGKPEKTKDQAFEELESQSNEKQTTGALQWTGQSVKEAKKEADDLSEKYGDRYSVYLSKRKK